MVLASHVSQTAYLDGPCSRSCPTPIECFEMISDFDPPKINLYIFSSSFCITGKQEITPKSIHFLDKSGVVQQNEHPFMTVKTDTYECMFGRDRHAHRKLEEQAKDEKRMMVSEICPLSCGSHFQSYVSLSYK